MSMRLSSLIFWVLIPSLLSGCASVYTERAALRNADSSAEYPVTTISARFEPTVTVDFAVSGKADGAKKGVGAAVLECSPSLAAGPFAPFIFVPCAALAGVVGGTVGAIYAAPKSEIDTFRQASKASQGIAVQAPLAEHARLYLAEVTGYPPVPAGPTLVGPESASERPVYARAEGAGGTLLEMGLQDVHYSGSGQAGADVCLYMSARGRKINAVTGELIEELNPALAIDCLRPENWIADEGRRFRTALEDGYKALARLLVDKLYFIYRSAERQPHEEGAARVVPQYALAPIAPRAPEMYLDLRVITKKARHVQGFGASHFVDVSSLSPAFSWERFPRAFDQPAGGFSAVSYDLRLYDSREVWDGKFAMPVRLLLERTGLTEPLYALDLPLQACTRYFWTVRARFTLNGTRRVTEWAGAYHTPGGEVAPSPLYYFPFRTPAASGSDDCWR